MIKILDIDKLFDKYIEKFVYENIGKVKPEEIENKIPELYEEFGNKKLKELDDTTPSTYYRQFPIKALLDCLKEHIEKGVAVSDFLCEAIRDCVDGDKTIKQIIANDNSEEYTLYLMNLLNDMNSNIALDRYLEFVLYDYSEPVRELAIELLSLNADIIKDKILENFNDCDINKKVFLTEILSNCKKRDDRVFDILVKEFMLNQHNIPLYAGYLAKYGDEKALPFLMSVIENDKIHYNDFEELRFAIEALGGEYTKKRDFTYDKVYKKIKSAENKNDSELN